MKAHKWRKERKINFFCIGPRLFNSLPPELCDLKDTLNPNKTRLELFIEKLDEYLNTIPDNPGNQANPLLNLENWNIAEDNFGKEQSR